MRRLSISLLLVVVVAIFGLGMILDMLFERYSATTADSHAQVRSFGRALATTLNKAEHPLDILAGWPDNEIFNVSLESKADLPLPPSLNQLFESGEVVVLESEQGVTFYFYLDTHNAVLALYSNSVLDNGRERIAWVFTGVFYLGTLALVLLWLKPLLYRLNILKNKTKAFGVGELDVRIQSDGFSYIQDIEQGFNRMAEKIQQLIEDNKLLTSAVSHDLRTPLARLRFGIDTLAETTSTDARERYIKRVNSDLSEMESLVNSLLRYASLDNVMAGADKQFVSLRSLVSECVSQQYDIDIKISIDDTQLDEDDALVIHGCIEHLAAMLNNLIQNAVKYAHHELLIELLRTKNGVDIRFCDDGPGIPVEQRVQLMKPFERGSASGKEGVGLGLALAVRIAKYHGGKIDIGSCEKLGGALICVCLKQ